MQIKQKFVQSDIEEAIATAGALAQGDQGDWFSNLWRGNVWIDTTISADDTLMLHDCYIQLGYGEVPSIVGPRPIALFHVHVPHESEAEGTITIASTRSLSEAMRCIYSYLVDQWLDATCANIAKAIGGEA
jgi:hypothetical protein